MKKLLAIAALTASTFTAQADVRINGFANFVGGITSSDDTLYGYDDTLGFSEESSFAIQMTGDINDKMTATGQVISRGENDYNAEFSWAYITYQATDKLSLSAGRLRLPLFKYSSSLDVGYSYSWVNAPQSVYNVTFNNIEGIRVDYSDYMGDWEYNAQLAYGTFKTDVSGGISSGDNTLVLALELQREWFKIRGVAGRATSTFAQAGVDGFADTLAAVYEPLGEAIRFNEDSGQFYGLSVELDNFDYFAVAEYTKNINEDTFLPEEDDFYITLGMRLGKFTPSVTYENSDRSEPAKFLDLVAVLPAEIQPTIAATVAGFQESFWNEFSVATVGIRYDYDTNIALKADLSKYDDKLYDTNDATLLRFAVNYVF